MGFFIQAVSVRERPAVLPHVSWRVPVPQVRRSTIVAAAGVAVGAALWLLYLYLMIHSTDPWVYVGFGLVGAACGLALVRIPALMWDFLRKQGYQVLLRQWTDRGRVLATAARRELRERDLTGDPQARNDLAVVDFLQGAEAQAAAHFQAAAAAGVGEAATNLLAALAENGQWEELDDHLAANLSLEGLTSEANLARLAARTPDEALLERLWKLAQDRQYPVVLNNLGVRALRSQQLPLASRALQLAAEVRPGYAYAHANQGVLLYRKGQLAPAVSEAASAAGLVAEDEVVFANLGAMLAEAGDRREARKWLTRAHNLQPRDTATLTNLGNVHSLDGEPEEALRALHGVLAGNPEDVIARYNLAAHLASTGHQTESLEHLQKAATQAPEDLDVLNNIGCGLFKQGDYPAAYEYFFRVARAGGSGAYRRNIVRAELAAGRHAEAASLLETSGDNDGLDLERGLTYLLRALDIKAETTTHRQMVAHNVNEAAAALTKAMTTSQATEAQLNYGIAQALRGDHVAAAEALAQTLRKGNGHPEMYYLTGMCYILAAQRVRDEHEVRDETLPPAARELLLKARPFLEKAAEVPAVAEVAAYDLGLLNLMVGEYQRAVGVLRKIARPDSPLHVVNTLAVAQAKLAQELQLSAQTATLMPEARRQEIRGQARQLLTGAVHYFKQALTIEPTAPLIHANLGLALMLRNHKGDVEAALEHWQLMHRHGDPRHRQTYEQFMQVVNADGARKLSFQEVELAFYPVNLREWLVLPPPLPSGFRWVVRELLDEPEWQLQAQHRRVRQALAYRQRAERVRRKLGRLAI